MEVIDQILNEWSFRCHDGIVDLNDPKKIKILFEVLNEYDILDEGIDDDIRNLLANADDKTKVKILSQLKKSSKKIDSNLKKILSDKGIGALVKTIIYDAEDLGQEDELLDYLHSPDQLTLSQLEEDNNLITLLGKTGLDEEFINALINITGNLGNVALGKGEVALTTLLKNAKRAEKGDISIDNKKIEIKSGDSKAVPDTLSRGSANDVNLLLIKLISDTFTDESVKKELIDNVSKLRAKGRWPAKVDNIYKTYLDQKQKGNTKSDFEDELNKIVKNLYKNYASEININDYLGQDFKADQFKLDIAKILAKAYFDQSDFNYILYFNPSNLNYKIYTENNFIESIGTELKVGGFSDALPRLTYSSLEQTSELNEGVSFSKDGNIIFSNSNNNTDLLFTGLKDANIGGVNVKYSMEYNQDNPDADNIKNLADRIKNLELDNKEELRSILSKDIDSLFSLNFRPKTVYYLGSSAPLSKMIGDIIREDFSDIKVLPLDKIRFPSWEGMLVDDYKDQIKKDDMLKRVETTAKAMWNNNKSSDGKGSVIKSSKLDPSIRKYFKPKYSLDDLLEKEALMFVDDNVQTGTDFKTIHDKFLNSSKIMFYTAIRLSRAGAKTTKASSIAKSNKIPFEFKKEDLIKLSSGVGVKSTYNDIEKLKSKGFIEKLPINIPGKGIYYLFKNKALTLDDLI